MRRTTRSSQSGRVVKKPQECRAHLKGRCTMGEGCYETHETPESTITCCAYIPKEDPRDTRRILRSE